MANNDYAEVQNLMSSILEEDMTQTLRADLYRAFEEPANTAGARPNPIMEDQRWPHEGERQVLGATGYNPNIAEAPRNRITMDRRRPHEGEIQFVGAPGNNVARNLMSSMLDDQMTPSLRADIIRSSAAPTVSVPGRFDVNQATAGIEEQLRVIREALHISDFRNMDFKNAIGQLTVMYNRVESSNAPNVEQVLQEIISLLLDRDTLHALSRVLYDELKQSITYFKSSGEFGGPHYQLVITMLAFFSYYCGKSMTFARVVSHGSCSLLDCIKMILKTLKVAHFLKKMSQRMDSLLLAGVNLAYKLVNHNDTETILCIKDRDVIDHVRPFVYSPNDPFKLSALLFTALVEESTQYQYHCVNPLALQCLIEAIDSRGTDYQTSQLLIALEHLIAFEGNVEMLLEIRLLPVMKALLNRNDVEQIQGSLHILTLLSDNVRVAELIFDDVIDLIRTNLMNHRDPLVQQKTNDLIRCLQEKVGANREFRLMARPNPNADMHHRERRNIESDLRAVQNGRHVMISYCWDNQEKVKVIKNYIECNGFEVWYDEDKINHGNLFDRMAEAVDDAWLVLVCFSSSYNQSKNCKREAQYAEQKSKPIIPVRLENFQANSWLEFILASQYTHDLSGDVSDRALYELVRSVSRLRANRLDGEPQMLTIGPR